MNEHPMSWISAYADGELKGDRLKQVEEHLAACRDCQMELEQIRKLSALLQLAPLPANLTSAERFAAQVRMRLPRTAATLQIPERQPPAWQKVLRVGWLAAPVGLIGGWAFLQAVLILSSFLARTGLGQLFESPSSLVFTPWPALPGMGGMLLLDSVIGMLPALEPSRSLIQIAYLELLSTVFVGVFLWSWLASWWLTQRQRG